MYRCFWTFPSLLGFINSSTCAGQLTCVQPVEFQQIHWLQAWSTKSSAHRMCQSSNALFGCPLLLMLSLWRNSGSTGAVPLFSGLGVRLDTYQKLILQPGCTMATLSRCKKPWLSARGGSKTSFLWAKPLLSIMRLVLAHGGNLWNMNVLCTLQFFRICTFAVCKVAGGFTETGPKGLFDILIQGWIFDFSSQGLM